MSGVCNLSGASRGVNLYLASQMAANPQRKSRAYRLKTTKIIEDQIINDRS